jgi:hypothetical protein
MTIKGQSVVDEGGRVIACLTCASYYPDQAEWKHYHSWPEEDPDDGEGYEIRAESDAAAIMLHGSLWITSGELAEKVVTWRKVS